MKDETGRTLRSLQSRISGAFKKIALASAALGAAAMAGIGLSIKVAADFEQQMIGVGKVVEGFDVHRVMLEDLAKTMSERWAVSTREVTSAMAFMGSMGKDALQVQSELNDVIQMGIALNMDMESAARLVASAQAIFSKEALSASEVADKLNEITNRTAATTEFLAGALRMAGPAAAATGVSMDELLGVMTPLAEAGFQGSMAGRALNMIFPKLSESAGELAEGLQSLHDRGFAVNIEAMQGFEDASPYDQIVMLSKATKNLDADTKREIATFIGGTQFFKQMFILLEGGEKVLEGTSYAIESIGSANIEAMKTTMSLNFRLAQLKQRILFMGMDIGERLLPSMQGFLDMLDGWMPAIKEAISNVGDFAKGIFDAAAMFAEGDWEAAGELLSEAFSGLGAKIRGAIAAVNWCGVFAGLITTAGTLWDEVKEELGNWGTKFKELLPSSPEEWDKVWDQFFIWTGVLWTKFKEVAGDIFTIFKAWLPSTSEEWWSVWEGFKSFAEHLWENFGNWMDDIETVFKEWVDDVNWDKVFDGLKRWAIDFGKWIVGKIFPFTAGGPLFPEYPGSGKEIPPINWKKLLDKLFNKYDWGGPQQFGGRGEVTRPTLFLAGERGREGYQFTPGGLPAGGGRTPSISIGAIYITAGDLGSEGGRRLAARDFVEQIGREWMRQR